jgi:hypothetical protein
MKFIKISALNARNRKIIITSRGQLFFSLTNNLINAVELYESVNIDSCKKALELLKTTNTSVKTFRSKFDLDLNDRNEYRALLYDMLTTNTTLNKIILTYKHLYIDDFKSICELLKNNRSISEIYIYAKYFDNNIVFGKQIVDALKFNKTLNCLNIVVMAFCRIDGKDLVELFNNNNTITNIKMKVFHVVNSDIMFDALKDNSSIVEMDFFNISSSDTKYCKRNAHNIRLKQMLIQDL